MVTQVTSANFTTATVTAFTTPTVSSITVTDNTYTATGATAVALTGGYVKIVGTNFVSGCTVYIDSTPATSVTFVSSTQLNAQVPALASNTYVVYIINPDGSVAIRVNGINYSSTPTWVTSGSQTGVGGTVSIQLVATSDSTITYSLASGSTLPSGLSLTSNGLLSGTVTGSGTVVYNFSVVATDLETQKSTQAFTISISFNDTYFSYTTLLLNGETSVTPFISDGSTNNNALTVAGNTKPTTFIPYNNDGYYSNLFNGSTDYLAITGAPSQLNIGTNSFTVECWINTSSTASYQTIFTICDTGSLGYGAVRVQVLSDKTVQWLVGPGGSWGLSPTVGSITYGTWNHIAITRSGSSVYFFINGIQVGTTQTYSTSLASGGTTYVALNSGVNYYFNGYISNLRFVNGTALYTSNFTPSTAPLTAVANTVLLTCQSNRFLDKSTNNFTLTVGSSPQISPAIPFTAPTSVTVNTGYSVYFSGTQADSFTVTGSTGFNIASAGSWTIEAWIYCTGLTSNLRVIACKDWSPGTTYASFGFNIAAANTLAMSIGSGTSGSTGNQSMNGTATISLNTWYHVAFVANSGTWTIYLNGAVDATGSITGTVGVSSNNVLLGVANNGYQFQGFMSNLRIVKSAVYTSAFTPSTIPLTAIANTQLLTFQGSQVVDISTNVYVLTPTNTPKVVNNTYPFTQTTQTVNNLTTLGSALLPNDGTTYTSYILGSTSPTLGTQDHTIEFWLYMNGAPQTYSLAWSYNNGATQQAANNYYLSIGSSGPNLLLGSGSASWTLNMTATLPSVNVWHHYAVTRSGSTFKIFVDGVQVSTGTSSQVITAPTTPMIIGTYTTNSANGNYIQGYISDFRYVVGTAVYTNNFVPPIAPLTAITNTNLLSLQYNGGVNNYGIIDNSPFNNIITRAGNATQGTFSPYSQTGWSTYIGTTAMGWQTPASSQTNIIGTSTLSTSSTFTIECWIYHLVRNPATGGGLLGLVVGAMNTTGAQADWGIGPDSSGKLTVWWYNGSAIVQAYSTNLIPLNTWTHFAVTIVSGVITMFINGVQETLTGTTTVTTVSSTQSFISIGGYTEAGTTWRGFNGYISNLRIIKNQAFYTSNFTPSTTPLVATTNTTLLSCQSNRFVDNSPNNYTLTIINAPSVQAYSPFGNIKEATPTSYSTYFAGGASDYLTVTTGSSQLNLPSDFTVELWFCETNTTPTIPQFASGTTGGFACGINAYDGNATRKLDWRAYGSAPVYGVTAITTNVWHHAAYVKSGSTFRIFLDGVLEYYNGSYSTTFTSTATYIGSQNSGDASYSFRGYISNFRVVKGTAVYTTSSTTIGASIFTPSTTPLTAITNTALLTCQSTRIIDNSTNALTMTGTGTYTVKQFNPFGYTAQTNTSYTPSLHGGSVYFDGTGDYLQIANNSIHASLSNNDFTIECWFYHTSLPAATQYILSHRMGAYVPFLFWTATSTLLLFVSSNNSSWDIINNQTLATLTAGQWYHLAYTRYGSTFKVFLNGVQVFTFTSSATFTATSNPLNVGASSTDTNAPFFGYITDVRMIRGISLYNSNFVLPSTPLTTSVTSGTSTYNAVVLLNNTNGGIVDQHSSNVLETVGNTQLSTSIKKYGNSSISFSGSSQYLSMRQTPNTQYVSGDFTIEFWVYRNNTSDGALYSDRGTGDYNGIVIGFRLSYVFILVSTSGSSWSLDTYATNAGSTVSTGAWNHIAVARTGSTWNFFTNGTLNYTRTLSGTVVQTATSVNIGTDSLGTPPAFNGYIDDLRITKGYARYTGNFTAPTSTLQTF